MVDLDDLLVRCRQGDEHAWEALVRRFQARIYGFALHYLRDREEARDVAQEIFIKMYQHRGSVHDGGAYLPWMLRLARNCCIDRVRSRAARSQELTANVEDAADLASVAASPEDSVVTEARHALLYRALDTLNDANREIVLLKDIQQLKLEEIATRLGLPLGTVKSRCYRARAELAKAVRSLDAPAGAVS